VNATFVQLLLILAQQVGGGLFMIWFFRWRKKEEKLEQVPSRELADFKQLVDQWQEARDKEYFILSRDVVGLRESVAKINGRLNGHEWKRG